MATPHPALPPCQNLHPAQQSSAGITKTMGPKKPPKTPKEPSETLAGASESGLNRLLNRGGERERQKERKRRNALLRKAIKESGLLAEPSNGPKAVCGAPAKQQIDEPSDAPDELSDDCEEVEWEDDEGFASPTAEQGAPSLEISFEEEEKKRESTGVRITKEDRMFQQLLHRVHLQCLLARGLLLDRASNDRVVQACMLSMMPKDGSFLAQKERASTRSLVSDVARWFKPAFSRVPDGDLERDYGRNNVPSPLNAVVDELQNVIEKRQGGAEELCALFASLLRALGLLVRIVSALDPAPLRPTASSGRKPLTSSKRRQKDNPQEPGKTAAKAKTRKNKKVAPKKRCVPGDTGTKLDGPQQKKRKGDEEFERQLEMAMVATSAACIDTEVNPEKVATAVDKQQNITGDKASGWSKNCSDLCCHWCEVFCGTEAEGRWVHVDPVAGWIDRCDAVEDGVVRFLPLTYVVAFNGGAKDVTKRYANDFLQSARHRDGDWWVAMLKKLQQETLLQSSMPEKANQSGRPDPQWVAHHHGRLTSDDLRAAREDAELTERAVGQQQAAPRTILDFKDHPIFVLKRHVGKYQALALDAVKAGIHRGEPYFLREHLIDVHTKQRWWKLGRIVREDEANSPWKTIGSVQDNSKASQNDEVVPPATKKKKAKQLYAIWQTDDWEIPVAKDGFVPKNEHGNVEVPPLCCSLPIGTVHLNYPYLPSVCKQLDIDFALAVVGFERSGHVTRPKIEGVVVCEEHQGMVMDGYFEAEREREEKAAEDREHLGRSGWISLLGVLWTRIGLEESGNRDANVDVVELDQMDGSVGSDADGKLQVETEEF